MQDIEERLEFTCAEMHIELWLHFVWSCCSSQMYLLGCCSFLHENVPVKNQVSIERRHIFL